MIRSFRSLRFLSCAALLLLAGCADSTVDTALDDIYVNNTIPVASAVPSAVPMSAPRPVLQTGIPVDKRVNVALLLPITGRHSQLGRAMQDAATLSLFDKYASLSPEQNRIRVELKTYDSGDTPEQAREAAERAIKDKAVLLIGPVFSDATTAVSVPARAAGVPVISFSNSQSVATPGVFLFGFSPEEQARRVIGHSAGQGRTQLAALVPNTLYGQTVLEAARKQITEDGGALVAQALYSPQGLGIDAAVNSILPSAQPPAFDSLFLPEAGAPLDTILRAMHARGARGKHVQLLGTGLWDDVLLITRVNLEGAWFATSPPQLTSAYDRRFISTYRYQPPRLSSLAYDAVALAVTIITGNRPVTEQTLTSPNGFSGPANGIFRFRKNGTSERGLAVLQVRGGQFVVVSPAPTGFAQ
ncbi:MAG: penicillin-binding protein activator [Alphaproteobacteria bacterium]|jgi:ABC-type branched-subunit amino acid transport system substrate-binding protein